MSALCGTACADPSICAGLFASALFASCEAQHVCAGTVSRLCARLLMSSLCGTVCADPGLCVRLSVSDWFASEFMCGL